MKFPRKLCREIFSGSREQGAGSFVAVQGENVSFKQQSVQACIVRVIFWCGSER